MFRSVYVDRPCEHCEKPRHLEIQFKTGCDGCESYDLGETVPPDDTMKSGETYEGVAFRYCSPCFRQWEVAERSALLGALADLIETGRLKVRKEKTDRWLSAGELRVQKVDASPLHQWEADSEGEEPVLFLVRFNHPFDLVWDGVEAKFPNDAYEEYARELNERIDRDLQAQGWAAGREVTREDIGVYLDEDLRIRVT